MSKSVIFHAYIKLHCAHTGLQKTRLKKNNWVFSLQKKTKTQEPDSEHEAIQTNPVHRIANLPSFLCVQPEYVIICIRQISAILPPYSTSVHTLAWVFIL